MKGLQLLLYFLGLVVLCTATGSKEVEDEIDEYEWEEKEEKNGKEMGVYLESEIESLKNDEMDDMTATERDKHWKYGKQQTQTVKDESTMDRIQKINKNVEGLTEIDIKEESNDHTGEKRNAVISRTRLWHTRDIPYVLEDSLSGSTENNIMKAFDQINTRTSGCISFHQKTSSDKYWLRYFKGSGCASVIGNKERSYGQTISIGPGCESVGIILHETFHALGFYHEQNRWDRDKYVEIFWENIESGASGSFERDKVWESDNLGTAYDYEGIMHYSSTTFSKNGKSTIQAIGNPTKKIGAGNSMTDIDADQLYKLYDCDTKSGWSTWTSWSPCDLSCKTQRTRACYSTSCAGSDKEERTCTTAECNIDGHWGKWSSWNGVSRSRECDDPAPYGDGKPCAGSSMRTNPPAEADTRRRRRRRRRWWQRRRRVRRRRWLGKK